MFAQLHQVPTPDLSVETLNALSAIMLGKLNVILMVSQLYMYKRENFII